MTAPLTEEARAAAELQAWAERAYQLENLCLTLLPEAISALQPHDPDKAARFWKLKQEKLAEIPKVGHHTQVGNVLGELNPDA